MRITHHNQLFALLRRTRLFALFILCLSHAAFAQVCRDDFPNCCASLDYTGGNPETLTCSNLIPESRATWTAGSSYTLTCQHGDTAATSECTWHTASGATCRYTHYRELKEYCDDEAVTFTGDISGNAGLCEIRVRAHEETHEGHWTCNYQNYKDNIYVEVQSEGMPTSKVLAITIPVCLILLILLILLLIFCFCPATLAAIWAIICCCRKREEKEKKGTTTTATSSSNLEQQDSFLSKGDVEMVQMQRQRGTTTLGQLPPIPAGSEEQYYETVVYIRAEESQGDLPEEMQPRVARKISNTTTVSSFQQGGRFA